MHYSQSEKHEIIKLVEQSDLGVIRTLRQLKINKTTFYNWYNLYLKYGYDGLSRKPSPRTGTWNKINQEDRKKVVEMSLDKPELSSRELAWYITDNGSCYISHELANYLEDKDMEHVRGRPMHPQTQGKIERYHRSMKKHSVHYSPSVRQFKDIYNYL
jgi:transposase-like protein